MILYIIVLNFFYEFSMIWHYSSTKYLTAITSVFNKAELLERVVVKHQLAIPISLEKYWRIHWGFLTILKTSNKSVWSNVFWYVKVCLLWKCIQYTIQWDKTLMLRKFPSDKSNGIKKFSLFSFASYNSSQFYF